MRESKGLGRPEYIENYGELILSMASFCLPYERAEKVMYFTFSRFFACSYDGMHPMQAKMVLFRFLYEELLEEVSEDEEEEKAQLTERFYYLLMRQEMSVKEIALLLEERICDVTQALEKVSTWDLPFSKKMLTYQQKRKLMEKEEAFKKTKESKAPLAARRRVSYLLATAACIAMIVFGLTLMRILT